MSDRTPVVPKIIAHWLLMGKQIVARVRSDETYSGIATVENERAVRQMLRYAHLGEQVEAVMDMYSAKAIDAEEVAFKVKVLVIKAIEDTRPTTGKVRCPEMHQKGTPNADTA